MKKDWKITKSFDIENQYNLWYKNKENLFTGTLADCSAYITLYERKAVDITEI